MNMSHSRLFNLDAECYVWKQKGIFIFSLITYKPLTYNKDYEYPGWAIFIGWCMALASMLCVPVYFFYRLLTTPGTLRQRWKVLTTPCLPIPVQHHTINDLRDEHLRQPLTSSNNQSAKIEQSVV